jgi:CDP-4-dehydro-6-deoxyglucose reductase
MSLMETFTATVSRVRGLADHVREIELTLIEPRQIRFEAGQFVSFEIERPGRPVRATRPYSIASAPERDDVLELVFNLVPGGPGSEYLFGLREGDRTAFRGPAGSFVVRDGPRDLLFVATGTGIAPIRSMLWSLAARSSPRAIALFWGLRSERDLYYQDELARLSEHLPNLRVTTTLSRPTGLWRGAVGRVTPLVQERVPTVDNLDVFLCGNGGMIRDVRDVIRRKGLCPIHTEQYYEDASGVRSRPDAIGSSQVA